MNIKLELLKSSIHDIIDSRLSDIVIDADETAENTAVAMLSEIQEIISNDKYDDFTAIEEIVGIFEKYHLDFGGRHDF